MKVMILYIFKILKKAVSTKSNNTNNISLKNNIYKSETRGLANSEKKSKCEYEMNSIIEDELLSLKNTLTPNEFFNSIKSGFELALCKIT